MSNTPPSGTIGFTGHHWSSAAKPCVKCGFMIQRGVVNIQYVNREFDPNFKVMCWECYHGLPKEWPTDGESE
jgi:hypothetical protein